MKPVHIHKTNNSNTSSTFYLLVPVFIFATVLALYIVISYFSNKHLATNLHTSVLGESNRLDNTTETSP